MSMAVDHAEVIASSAELPGFPGVIRNILATLDDPDANLRLLTGHIKHDPVIAARVLSMANAATRHTQYREPVRDPFTAISLIGAGRLRTMVIATSLAGFLGKLVPPLVARSFWEHSVAVGVCAEELAAHVCVPAPHDAALVAGLLHDIGQLWFYRFRTAEFLEVRRMVIEQSMPICTAEAGCFGVDHGVVGAWLAAHWQLPDNIVTAVRLHHDPDSRLDETLVPLVHVAEVLANALDLHNRPENRVTVLSAKACARLCLEWGNGDHALFGRIEARSRHATQQFAAP